MEKLTLRSVPVPQKHPECSEGSGCQPGLEDVQKLVILGSGPAGLSAAIYAARATLDPVVISVDGQYPEPHGWGA